MPTEADLIQITPTYVTEAMDELEKITSFPEDVPLTEEQCDSLVAHIRHGVADMPRIVRELCIMTVRANDSEQFLKISTKYAMEEAWLNVIVLTSIGVLMAKNRGDLAIKALEERPCASA